MGIPSYFSYIVKNHPEIIKKFQKGKFNVHNLYLDCNSIIYDVFQKIDYKTLTETISLSIIKQVCSKIDMYIKMTNPSNTIIIAFDGVAPVAKLDQQRNRRYKSSYQNNILRNIYKKEADPWNSVAITPGTKFMNDLSIHIKSHFKDPLLYNVKNIINSTSDIYGEGEHKIFEYIRDNEEEHKNKNTVIYGLDADLIMLSINHLPICPTIYLFRETPHFIQSIDKSLEPNENYLLDIPLLTTDIMNSMNNNLNKNNNLQQIKIYDYIFLSFFLGNDFLPHFPALNIRTGGMDKMLNAYKMTIGKTNEVLTDGKQIYWKNVRILVNCLAAQEEDYLKQEHKLRNKREKFHYPTDTPEEVFKKFESLPTYERDIEKYINPFQPYWETRYYKSLFQIQSDSTNQRKKDICMNYLEGLEWTLKYYTSGCPNWRWSYNYHYPPLLRDLLQYIPVFDTTFIQDELPNPVSPLVQLCYVLPKESLTLLPSPLQKELLEHHSDWYKTDCEFVWSFCRYFWESHVKMNEIDLNELEMLVKKYKF